MKIGIITTLNTNIGDDFIREGILRICAEIFKGKEIEYTFINKHDPYSIYSPKFSITPLIKKVPGFHIYMRALKWKSERYFSLIGNRLADCDLIIQSGAPVIWPNCSGSEWALPIWENTIGKLYDKIPVWDIAAGSCYPWEHIPEKIENDRDLEFIQRINKYSKITTCRDKLALKLFDTTGYMDRHSLLTCTAFQFTDTFQKQSKEKILISYMPGGGHFDWGQKVDNGQWDTTVRTVVKVLSKNFSIVYLCHNQKEVEEAKKLDPGCQTVLPTNKADFLAMTNGAKMAICNRMHASVALASLGIPSIAIGTDTRLLMVKELGLPIMYVKEATVELILESFETLQDNYTSYQGQLADLKNRDFRQYIQRLG